MELMGQGRDCDVFDIGDGRVLRRSRSGRPALDEAAVITYAAEHGYPVPRVYEVAGPDMVMEKVDGVEMLDDIMRHPWRLLSHAKSLARLHHRLHAIPAPDWVPEAGEGSSLIHMDLHPLNVMITANGPVVIDWVNARRGPGALDVGWSWVVMSTATVDGPWYERAVVTAVRRLFVRTFLKGFERPEIVAHLGAAVDHWTGDRNSRPEEQERARRLLARETARSSLAK